MSARWSLILGLCTNAMGKDLQYGCIHRKKLWRRRIRKKGNAHGSRLSMKYKKPDSGQDEQIEKMKGK